jgi:MoxR-like ATPase
MLNDPKELSDSLALTSDGANGAHYILDADTRLALRMAWATGRPLLIVGEPGCGKTQLAQALACEWKVPLRKQVVNAHTKAEDLLYHFDAVGRLADAQVYGALREEAADKTVDPLDPAHYLRPGPLWEAWNWQSAADLLSSRPKHRPVQPSTKPTRWKPEHGCVVLIDEIDKAGIEVPEGLLEVLDTGSFDVPWTGTRVEPNADNKASSKPLVLITSNGARDLPAPFLRRCIVLPMTVPDTGLEAWLQARARAHFSNDDCDDEVTLQAATLMAQERAQARSDGRYIPGVAEYLDLVKAVVELAKGDSQAQIALMRDMAPAVTTAKGKAVAT